MTKRAPGFHRREVDSIYLDDPGTVRFVVSYIMGVQIEPGVETPEDALRVAVSLTQDDDADGTFWHVYDRATGFMYQLEQGGNYRPRLPWRPE